MHEKIKETDQYISDFYHKSPQKFFQVFFLYCLLIMLWVTEIHLALLFLGVYQITYMDSFLLTILGNLAMVFPFIPASLGIYEITYMLLYRNILGRNPNVALALVFIRRIIALLLAGLGLLGLVKLRKKEKS